MFSVYASQKFELFIESSITAAVVTLHVSWSGNFCSEIDQLLQDRKSLSWKCSVG